MAKIGVITEQGDLGLGFNPLTNKDEKTVKEHPQATNKDTSNKDKK